MREYSSWQQSRLGDEILKAEVRKACDVALDDGLDLAQIDEDKDPSYFKARGVKGVLLGVLSRISGTGQKYTTDA